MITLAAWMFEEPPGVRWQMKSLAAKWPDATGAARGAGLIVTIGEADAIVCRACGEAHEVKDTGDRARTYFCPLAGRRPAPKEDLEQVAFHGPRWLELIGEALHMQPREPVCEITDRLWRFTGSYAALWRREIWIGRDLSSEEGFSAVERVFSGNRRAKVLLSRDASFAAAFRKLNVDARRIADCVAFGVDGRIEGGLSGRACKSEVGRGGRGGRPTKVRRAISVYNERVDRGLRAASLRAEAKIIRNELLTDAPSEPSPELGTIENVLRKAYDQGAKIG